MFTSILAVRHFPLIARRLLAVVLILLLQGPLMLVQEIAWARMLVSYSMERGVTRGVVETFDGEHPCAMCKKVRKLREQEQRKDPAEMPPSSQRMRYAWAEMLPAEGRLRLRPRTSSDLAAHATPWRNRWQGRGVPPPESPPPEAA